MGLPSQFLYTVLDVSVRWGRSQSQIIDWAIADEMGDCCRHHHCHDRGRGDGRLHHRSGQRCAPAVSLTGCGPRVLAETGAEDRG